mmetsp:Transcript_17607/g.53257  ORF Transcript_17607/g.53257 Transcript_17607/m.53257 type:complete len:280 (-) Transcript_17607:1592-2431(-)
MYYRILMADRLTAGQQGQMSGSRACGLFTGVLTPQRCLRRVSLRRRAPKSRMLDEEISPSETWINRRARPPPYRYRVALRRRAQLLQMPFRPCRASQSEEPLAPALTQPAIGSVGSTDHPRTECVSHSSQRFPPKSRPSSQPDDPGGQLLVPRHPRSSPPYASHHQSRSPWTTRRRPSMLRRHPLMMRRRPLTSLPHPSMNRAAWPVIILSAPTRRAALACAGDHMEYLEPCPSSRVTCGHQGRVQWEAHQEGVELPLSQVIAIATNPSVPPRSARGWG